MLQPLFLNFIICPELMNRRDAECSNGLTIASRARKARGTLRDGVGCMTVVAMQFLCIFRRVNECEHRLKPGDPHPGLRFATSRHSSLAGRGQLQLQSCTRWRTTLSPGAVVQGRGEFFGWHWQAVACAGAFNPRLCIPYFDLR